MASPIHPGRVTGTEAIGSGRKPGIGSPQSPQRSVTFIKGDNMRMRRPLFSGLVLCTLAWSGNLLKAQEEPQFSPISSNFAKLSQTGFLHGREARPHRRPENQDPRGTYRLRGKVPEPSGKARDLHQEELKALGDVLTPEQRDRQELCRGFQGSSRLRRTGDLSGS